MGTASLSVTYKTYKDWEDFLGDNATEKEFDTGDGHYWKELCMRVGSSKLTVIGPEKRKKGGKA